MPLINTKVFPDLRCNQVNLWLYHLVRKMLRFFLTYNQKHILLSNQALRHRFNWHYFWSPHQILPPIFLTRLMHRNTRTLHTKTFLKMAQLLVITVTACKTQTSNKRIYVYIILSREMLEYQKYWLKTHYKIHMNIFKMLSITKC